MNNMDDLETYWILTEITGLKDVEGFFFDYEIEQDGNVYTVVCSFTTSQGTEYHVYISYGYHVKVAHDAFERLRDKKPEIPDVDSPQAMVFVDFRPSGSGYEVVTNKQEFSRVFKTIKDILEWYISETGVNVLFTNPTRTEKDVGNLKTQRERIFSAYFRSQGWRYESLGDDIAVFYQKGS